MSRAFIGKADEITTSIRQRSSELTHLLDEKGSGLLNAISTKSGHFSAEIERVAARIINDASASAALMLSRTLKELEDTSTGSVS